jgi:hypothetical protein
MTKYLHPDRETAIKYVIAAFILYVLDYLIPVLGFISIILLFLGIKPFMHDENNHFKVAYKSLKKMTVAYVIMKLAVFVPETGLFKASTSTVVRLIAMGIATIYFIYVTHYFTEGILLDAKTAKINFVKLGLNTPWILMGVFVMAHFVCAVTFKQPIPSITVVIYALCILLHQAVSSLPKSISGQHENGATLKRGPVFIYLSKEYYIGRP